MIAVAALALSGCTHKPKQTPPTGTASPSPSSTLSPAEQQAADQVLAAYRGYLAVTAKANTTATADSGELGQYLTDPLLTQTLVNVHNMQVAGQVYTGALVSGGPRVTALNLSTDPATATVEDCLDASNYRKVRKDSGSPVSSPGQTIRRFTGVTNAILVKGKGWRINQSEAHQERPC
jgi:hypothetical protein